MDEEERVARAEQEEMDRQPVPPTRFKTNFFTEICCGTEAGSYLRLIYSCITQLKAQGPFRTCNESKEAEEEAVVARMDEEERVAGEEQEEKDRHLPPWKQPRGKS